jgi:hypothetical protein
VILGFPTQVDSRDDLAFQLAHKYSYEFHKLKDIHTNTKVRGNTYSYIHENEKTYIFIHIQK